jgi:hypothetical protein
MSSPAVFATVLPVVLVSLPQAMQADALLVVVRLSAMAEPAMVTRTPGENPPCMHFSLSVPLSLVSASFHARTCTSIHLFPYCLWSCLVDSSCLPAEAISCVSLQRLLTIWCKAYAWGLERKEVTYTYTSKRSCHTRITSW